VATVSASRYWLDLDRRLLRRVSSPVFQATLHLRGDGEDVDLVEVVDCRIGHPMVLLINLGPRGELSSWFRPTSRSMELSGPDGSHRVSS
jgi:hypothetical protein